MICRCALALGVVKTYNIPHRVCVGREMMAACSQPEKRSGRNYVLVENDPERARSYGLAVV